MQKRIIVFTGSRGITDKETVEKCVLNAIAYTDGAEVRVGDAAGVDRIVIDWCKKRDIPVTIYKPWWEKYGKAAGPIRNLEMVTGATEVHGIWDGHSKGTRNCLNESLKLGLPTTINVIKNNNIENIPSLWNTLGGGK